MGEREKATLTSLKLFPFHFRAKKRRVEYSRATGEVEKKRGRGHNVYQLIEGERLGKKKRGILEGGGGNTHPPPSSPSLVEKRVDMADTSSHPRTLFHLCRGESKKTVKAQAMKKEKKEQGLHSPLEERGKALKPGQKRNSGGKENLHGGFLQSSSTV